MTRDATDPARRATTRVNQKQYIDRGQSQKDQVWEGDPRETLEGVLAMVVRREFEIDVLLEHPVFLAGLRRMSSKYVRDAESLQNVDDAVQDLLVRIIEHWRRIEGDSNPVQNFPDLQSFIRWIYTILRNQHIDRFRAGKRRPVGTIRVEELELAAGEGSNGGVKTADRQRIAYYDDILGDCETHEQEDLLTQALQRLTKREQDVLRFRINEELDFRKIGKALKSSHTTARKIYTGAVGKLRHDLLCA